MYTVLKCLLGSTLACCSMFAFYRGICLQKCSAVVNLTFTMHLLTADLYIGKTALTMTQVILYILHDAHVTHCHHAVKAQPLTVQTVL